MSIFNHFRHLTLSGDQASALEKIESFLNSDTQVFMLKGYAGSGKTTILKGLVEFLNAEEKEFALMAPTGRAAKVIREKTGQEAFTIHKSIYSYEDLEEVENMDIEGGKSFFYYYKIRNNTDVANKIFIVDEASMLSDAKSQGEFFRFGTDHLLSDLITYTRIVTGTAKSKIIFVGDPCQLAPVGDNISKAFEEDYLRKKFQLSIDSAEMKQVKRQEGDSGILRSATKIRQCLSSKFFNDFNLQTNGKDIYNPTYETFLRTYFATSNPKIIVAYKNKTCLQLNLQIRKHRFGDGHLPMQKGDIVIIGGNNYRKQIFNGEFAVVNDVAVESVSRTVTFYRKPKPNETTSNKSVTETVTLRWRKVGLVFPDAESSNKVVSGQMLENFLYGDTYLTPEEMQALYVDFKKRHENIKPKTEEFKEAILNDEYFNCLKVKYGYAVTCHKAQGGEWNNVFTVWDHDNRENFNFYRDPQIKAGKSNEGFYRWAYTAVTRASYILFAINPPRFNSYSTMAIMELPVVSALNELTNTPRHEEVQLDDDLLNQITQLNLLEQPIQLQDHFIQVRHALRKQYIDVTGWQKKNMEIFYLCQREGKTAGVKTWINQKLLFNGKYLKLTAQTNNDDLYAEIEAILKNLTPVVIKRNTSETILSRLEFEFDLEEKFPFTRILFEDVDALFQNTAVCIENIEHQQYKERYTFKRQSERVVLDFEYNANGFFGRVVPIQNKTNSLILLGDILKAIRTLKQEEYAS